MAAPNGVERFLLGRQQLVVPLGFLAAQIMNFEKFPASDLNYIWRLIFVGLGLPAILIFLQFCQLAPQLLAEENPRKFLEMRGGFVLVFATLVVERLGLSSVTWGMLRLIKGFSSIDGHSDIDGIRSTDSSSDSDSNSNSNNNSNSNSNGLAGGRDKDYCQIEEASNPHGWHGKGVEDSLAAQLDPKQETLY